MPRIQERHANNILTVVEKRRTFGIYCTISWKLFGSRLIFRQCNIAYGFLHVRVCF